jgi:hypothetical protein
MLDELRRLTSTEPYKSRGGMWIKEIVIMPWQNPEAKFVFELSDDDVLGAEPQVWEVICSDLAGTEGIPQALIPRTQIKIYNNHPLLWNFENEIFFSIKSKTDDISSLMGDLFIQHSKTCGNWIDFHWLYSGLPETLSTMRENQLAIPQPLQNACFSVLDKYRVEYSINEIKENKNGYSVLLFSNTESWPDEECFGQSHIIAKEFSERRVR